MILTAAGPTSLEIVTRFIVIIIIVSIVFYIIKKYREKQRIQENVFCIQCGASVSASATYCNKCGSMLRKGTSPIQIPVMKVSNINLNQKKSSRVLEKNNKGLFGILAGIVLLIVLIVIAVAVFSGIKKETSIYGTWTDANKTITFTFNEDGNLRISGANNILGADAFQFTEEDGVLHLQAQGLAGIGVDLEYEIVDDTLLISIIGQSMTLYRSEDSAAAEDIGDTVENWVEDKLDAVQVYSLYGTWTDSNGAISFTFSEDGKVRISGMSDILSVDAFTFTEVDDDTLQLKADTDNPIAGMVGLNMDYEIEGDTMTVSIAGKEVKLVKKE